MQGVGAHVEEDAEQAGGGDVAQRRRYLSTMLENLFFVVNVQISYRVCQCQGFPSRSAIFRLRPGVDLIKAYSLYFVS